MKRERIYVENRRKEILSKIISTPGIRVEELATLFDVSAITIRRDLQYLEDQKMLTRYYGGASPTGQAQQIGVQDEVQLYRSLIAKYAASLVEPGGFIYLDAGTTTGCMLDYLLDTSVTYVTNGVSHAQRLVKKGMKVILLGGELKATTEAVIGSQAVQILMNYHFSIGFFGANGITQKAGFTTPDREEAGVKHTALWHCKKPYVLADSSKFDSISPVKFAEFEDALIITEKKVRGYEECPNIILTESDGKEMCHDLHSYV